GAIATLAHGEHGRVVDVVHETDAARAEDAAVRHVHHVAAEIFHGIEPLGLAVARVGASFLERVVLQLALARLVADRAIERMVDEQHLEDSLAGLEGFLAIHMHYLPFDDRGRASRRELRRLRTTHGAHPPAPGNPG